MLNISIDQAMAKTRRNSETVRFAYSKLKDQWITYRTTRLRNRLVLDWKPLKEPFGEGFGRDRGFRAQLRVLDLFPKLSVKLTERGLEMEAQTRRRWSYRRVPGLPANQGFPSPRRSCRSHRQRRGYHGPSP